MPYWLHDYRREKELEAKQKEQGINSQPVMGHEIMGNSTSGFDRNTFNIEMIKDTLRARRS